MTRTVKFDGRPIWAEVSLGALTHNLRAIRQHVNPAGTRGPRRKILAVIKSNAYGHGIVPVARALSKVRADWFGVTCSAEGAELRESGIREPVLILTGFWAGEEKRILDNHLTPAIMSADQLRLLEKAAALQRKPRKRPFDFHLKIDTGMNRLGIPPSEIPAFARALADCPHVRLAGTFTHIASSEVFTTEQTIEQEKTFDAALACMRSLGLDPGIVHMANSAAIVSRPSTWRDMVRPGAILYGYHQFFEPSELNPEMEAKLSVRPVLSFRARIVSIKDLAAGIARRIQRALDGVRRPLASPCSPRDTRMASCACFPIKAASSFAARSLPSSARFRWTSPPPTSRELHRRAWAISPRSTAPTAARRNPFPTSRRLPIPPARTCSARWESASPAFICADFPST